MTKPASMRHGGSNTCIQCMCWLMLILSLTSELVTCQMTTEIPAPKIVFTPCELLLVPESTTHEVSWNTTLIGVHHVVVTSSDTKVASVSGNVTLETVVESVSELTASGSFEVAANFLGYSTFTLRLLDNNDELVGTHELEVSVILAYQLLNDIFSTSLAVLAGLLYVIMGATIDLDIVKRIIRRPVGPIIGLVCQYVAMPLVAFGLGQVLFPGDPLFQLGAFMSGCCPGGGNSNMWTHLLDGNLDLSITMTFCSTIVAFAAVPAWVFALGPVIAKDANFTIPFTKIAIIIVSLIVPCGVGILIQRYLPRVSRILKKLLTPFALIIMMYTFSFGLYANRFILKAANFKVYLFGLCLPTIGYLFGVLAAYMMRLPRADVVAISIETGIQNLAIVLFILTLTIEPPAGVLSTVVSSTVFIMTPVPLFFIYIIKLIRDYLVARRNKEQVTNEKVGNASVTVGNISQMHEKQGIDNPAADISDTPKLKQ